MKIVVWNLKGGQGKTVISLSIAMLRNAYVVTNDVHSPITEVIGADKAKTLQRDEALPPVPDDIELIYDFGGYPDLRTREAIEIADYVVVPIIFDSPLELQVTINAIAEIIDHRKKIIIIVNKAKKNDFTEVKEVIDRELGIDSIKMFELKASTAYSRSIVKKKSLQQLVNDYPLWRAPYQKALNQIEEVINYIF